MRRYWYEEVELKAKRHVWAIFLVCMTIFTTVAIGVVYAFDLKFVLALVIIWSAIVSATTLALIVTLSETQIKLLNMINLRAEGRYAGRDIWDKDSNKKERVE